MKWVLAGWAAVLCLVPFKLSGCSSVDPFDWPHCRDYECDADYLKQCGVHTLRRYTYDPAICKDCDEYDLDEACEYLDWSIKCMCDSGCCHSQVNFWVTGALGLQCEIELKLYSPHVTSFARLRPTFDEF